MIPSLRLKAEIREQVGAIRTQCAHLFEKIDIDVARALTEHDSAYDLVPSPLKAMLAVRLSAPAVAAHASLACSDEQLRQALDFPLQFLLVVGSHGCSSFHWFGPVRFGDERKFQTQTKHGQTLSSRFIERIIETITVQEIDELRQSVEMQREDATSDASILSECECSDDDDDSVEVFQFDS